MLETDSTRPAGVLSLKVDAQELQARYRPMQDEASASLFLNVAVLGFGLTTRVRDGENAGRTLDHEFVVLGFRRLPMTSTQGMHHAGGGLPAPRTEAPRYGVAAWVSRQGSQAPLQVVGGLLTP